MRGGKSIHVSSPFQCSLCGTGIINVRDQILQHLESQKHKKKCHEYCVSITSTEKDGTSCLTPDLIEAHRRAHQTSAPIIVYPEYKSDAIDFPSLGGIPNTVSSSVASASSAVAAASDVTVPLWKKAIQNRTPVSSSYSANPQVASQPSSFMAQSCTAPVTSGFGRGRGRGTALGLSTMPKPVAPVEISTINQSTNMSVNTLSHSSSKSSFTSLPVGNDVQSAPMRSGLPPPMSSEPQKITTAKDILHEWRDGQKEALMAVNEIVKCMRWEHDYEEICPEDGAFTFRLLIDGKFVSKGSGATKQAAKRTACQNSQNLLAEWIKAASRAEEGITGAVSKTPMDHYGEMSYGKLKQMKNEACRLIGQIEMPSHFAAFILTTSDDQPAQNGIIVAFGTGNHILPKTEASLLKSEGDHGRSLFDMRALTIARRALQLFLASQLKALFLSSIDKEEPPRQLYIEFDHINGFVNLRPGHRLHLFMSHTPDGDATAHPLKWLDSDHLPAKEKERDLNGKCSSYPVNLLENQGNLQYVSCRNPPHDMTLRFKLSNVDPMGDKDEPLNCMALSDKMLLWCRLGFQGSLLSQWFQTPVRPYSIQVGLEYDHGSFARALFVRLQNPPTATHVRVAVKAPFLGRVSSLPTNYSRMSQPYSLNYFLSAQAETSNSSSIEVIDTNEGHVCDTKQPSRLSRVAALQRYLFLVLLTDEYFRDKPHLKLKNMPLISSCPKMPLFPYFKLKQITYQSRYRRAKSRFMDAIQDSQLGGWLGRPAKLQDFCLLDFKIN